MGLLGSDRMVIKEQSVRKDGARTTTIHSYYTVIRTLGKGGQGKTELVENQRNGKFLVRKLQREFRMQGDIPKEMYIFENILTRHPSIVGFDHANYMRQTGDLVLYFEHCRGGDLHRCIPTKNYVSEDFIWHIFIQLADALAFLHYGISRRDPYPPSGWQRVIHRDIKPENIFLRRPIEHKHQVPDVVLGDFGLATLQEVSEGCGTDVWVAPEGSITKQGDVWGLGAVIHALAHGRGPVARTPPPEWPRGREALEDWLWHPKARKPKPMSCKYSCTLNTNMMDCLVIDPKKRVSSKELLYTLEKEMPRHLR